MKKKIIAPILLLIVLITGLFVCNQIPFSWIEENLNISAMELEEIPVRHPILGTYIGSIWDTTADSITCSIIAANDGTLSSMLSSKYLEDNTQTYPENLIRILQGEAPNCNYARYWHGATGFYRILLMVMPISGIRVIALGFYLILMAILYGVCLKKDYPGLFSVTAISHFLVGIPGLFCSLETIPIALLCVLSELIILLVPKEWYISCFAMFGVAAAFFDFLTAETLTCTIPLLICMYLGFERPVAYLKDGCAWILGYIGTFLAKWGMSSLVCSPGVLIGTESHITQWFLPDWKKSITMTLLALFPWTNSLTSAIGWGIGILTGAALLFLFFRAKKTNWSQIGLILSVNLIPVARFLLLNGHAAEHFYFVPRMFLTIPMSIGLLFLTQSLFRRKKDGWK